MAEEEKKTSIDAPKKEGTKAKKSKTSSKQKNVTEKNKQANSKKTQSTTEKQASSKTVSSTRGKQASGKTAPSTTEKQASSKTVSSTKGKQTKSRNNVGKQAKSNNIAEKKLEAESKKDTKKIEKSEEIKKSKRKDDRIKQLIKEQVKNVDKINEIKDIEEEKKPSKKEERKLNEEKISEQIEKANRIPKEEKMKIYKDMGLNIFLGIIYSLYFVLLELGAINIEGTAFVRDLRIFSIGMLTLAIILFEYSYNKDSGKHALIGIESLAVAISTFVLLYIYILYGEKYLVIGSIITCTVTVYYLIKTIATYVKDKSNWKKSISDVKEIISE